MLRRGFLRGAAAAAFAGFTPLSGNAQELRTAARHTPLGLIRTNWSRDPYSFGSYSFIAQGAKQRDTAILAEPVGDRLFFAGEATHPKYNSTVHAAFETGLIAAKAIEQTGAENIAVIGAGVSGLTAGTLLIRSECDVTVLEARDRIGGRIWTDSRLGAPLDLGASWIHGADGNPLTELANNLGLETAATDDSFIARGRDGRVMGAREYPDWLEDVLSVEHDYGATREEINLRSYWLDRDYGGDELIFPGGYAQIFAAVDSRLSILLDTEIEAISVSGDGIRVTDRTGVSSSFDAVLVTVPLGVLKQDRIAFDPPLPEEKQAAISRLGMGLLDKVYFLFGDVFWDRDVTWIGTPENGLPPGQFNQWLNLAKYLDEPIIMAFNGGPQAHLLADLSDEDITTRALRTLELAYPG